MSNEIATRIENCCKEVLKRIAENPLKTPKEADKQKRSVLHKQRVSRHKEIIRDVSVRYDIRPEYIFKILDRFNGQDF